MSEKIKDTYLTLSKNSSGLCREKGSKFLAFAYPVASNEEINWHLNELRKLHHDARHHCYAYLLGTEGQEYRANDAGEPKHSAGDPILGQLRSRQLTDVLLVVVRYFGGTKLGVSGLINAYKTAAASAIDNNQIMEKTVTEVLRVKYDYAQTNQVMYWIKSFTLEIVDQQFGAECILKVAVKKNRKASALKALTKDGGIQVMEVGE